MKKNKNDYYRISFVDIFILVLTNILNTNIYNRSGYDTIIKTLTNTINNKVFLLKIHLTILTLSSGFKGGEIIHLFFIGSTFGYIININSNYCASIGLI